jgi:hypothetical protein
LDRVKYLITVAALAWAEIRDFQASEGVLVIQGSQEKAQLNVAMQRVMETPT